MIRKISKTLLRDLLVPASLIGPKNIPKFSYKAPLVEVFHARFSTNTPKLKRNN